MNYTNKHWKLRSLAFKYTHRELSAKLSEAYDDHIRTLRKAIESSKSHAGYALLNIVAWLAMATLLITGVSC